MGSNNAVRGVLVVGAVFTLASCGKPSTATSPLGQAGDGSGQTDIKGFAGFGSQCSSGYNSDPKAVKLELWDCPVNFGGPVELAEPMTPIMFNADCNRKVLTVRTLDRAVDSSFYMMPDGSFYISQDKLTAKFKTDGSGNNGCTTPIVADIWGKVDCIAGDKAKIRFETVMWLNKTAEGTTPITSPTGTPNLPPVGAVPATTPSGAKCKLPPAKCYFHIASSVTQC